MPGGEGLGVHNHHGTVIVYTVQGAWRYLEHEWTAKAGDFVDQTAGSQHTLIAEPGEDLVAFIVIEAVLEFLDPQGQSMGLENWKTFLDPTIGSVRRTSSDPWTLVGSSEKRAEEQGAAQSRSRRRGTRRRPGTSWGLFMWPR